VTVAGTTVGVVGELDPDVAAGFGIGERVAWLEVDFGALFDGPKRPAAHREVSRFPSSDIDLALITPDDESAAAVERTLSHADPLVWSVELFDLYRGDQVPPGHRSLAFRVRLQATDRTLTEAEVGAARERLIASAAAAHRTVLRGPV
jgi:phenylalanyl-tRNA synthetase beta chain